MQATIIVREDAVKDLVMPGLTTTQEPHHREEMTTAFIHEETTSQQEGGPGHLEEDQTLPPLSLCTRVHQPGVRSIKNI